MKTRIIALCLVIAATGIVAADNYDLAAYLAVVEKNSRDLVMARKDVAIAEQATAQARSALLPTVATFAEYSRNLQEIKQPMAALVNTNYAVAPGVYPVTYMDTVVSHKDNLSAGIMLNQAIFNLKAWHGLRYGQEYSSLTNTIYSETNRGILTLAKKLYYQVVLLQEVLKVKEASERNNHETYLSVKKRFEIGVAQELEALRAEVVWKNKATEVTQSKKDLELSMVGLRSLAGLDLQAPVVLTGSLRDYPNIPALPTMSDVLAARTDYALLVRQKKMAEISRDLATADFFPTVSAGFGVVHNAYDDDFDFNNPAYKTDAVQLSVKIALPLYTGGARLAEIQKDELNIDKKDVELRKKEDAVQTEVTQIYLTLKEARERIDSAEKVLEIAEKAFNIAQVSLQNGMITQIEVNESSVQLEQARLLQVSAIFDYLIAYFDWEKATGRL
jgi:outer membrane protein